MLQPFSSPRRKERDLSLDTDMDLVHSVPHTNSHMSQHIKSFKWNRDNRLVGTWREETDAHYPESDCTTATTLVASPQSDAMYHSSHDAAQGVRHASSPSPSESISVVNASDKLQPSDRKFSIPGWNVLIKLAPLSFTKRKLQSRLRNKFATNEISHEKPIVSRWLNHSSTRHSMTKPIDTLPKPPGYVHEIDNDFLGAELAVGSWCASDVVVHELESTRSTHESNQRCELEGSSYLPLTSVLNNTDISSLEGHPFEPSSCTIFHSNAPSDIVDEQSARCNQQDTSVSCSVSIDSNLEVSTVASSASPQRADIPSLRDVKTTGLDVSAQQVERSNQDMEPRSRSATNEETLDNASEVVELVGSMQTQQLDHRKLKLIILPKSRSTMDSDLSNTLPSSTVFSVISTTASSAPTSPASAKLMFSSPTAISPVSQLGLSPPATPTSPWEPISPLEDTIMLEHGDLMQQILREVDSVVLPEVIARFSAIGAARFEARMQNFLCNGAAGIRTHAAGGDGSGARPGSSRVMTNSKSHVSNGVHKKVLGKHPRDDDEDSGREDNEGRKQPSRHNVIPPIYQKKLACPFQKSNPAMFRLRPNDKRFKTCSRGFKDSKDLKEHLKLVHLGPPFFCDRCCMKFKTEDEKTAHVKQTQPCQVWHDPEFSLVYIMSKDRRDKVFKKKSAKHTDEQFWYGLWTHIFPESELPSSIYHDFPELEAVFDQAVDEVIPKFANTRAMEIIRPEINAEDEARYLRKVFSAIREHVFDQLDNGNHSWSLATISSRSSSASQVECDTVSRGSPAEFAAAIEQSPTKATGNLLDDWNPQPASYALHYIPEPESDNTIDETDPTQCYLDLDFEPHESSQQRGENSPPPTASVYGPDPSQLDVDLGHGFTSDDMLARAFVEWPYESPLLP